jgi:hypothetical protein
MSNDDPDGTTLAEERSAFLKNCRLMSFNICCQFEILMIIFFFLGQYIISGHHFNFDFMGKSLCTYAVYINVGGLRNNGDVTSGMTVL